MTNNKLNICIVHPNRNAFSETFIRNHIKYLPGNIFDLYGGWFPAFDKNDNRIADDYVKRSLTSRLIIFICKLLPAFIANRIPSAIKGYPYNEDLNEKAFRFFLKKRKIDVVLAEFMIKGVIIKDVCNDLKIPFVLHTHGGGDIMNQIDFETFSASYADLFYKASKVISVDSYSSRKLLELGLEKKKLIQIGYGVDLNLFSPTKPSDNSPVFFGVGRFVDKKAPYLTVLAFAEVVKIHPMAQLIIAGKGALYDCCLQTVKALKIESHVSFPGVLSPYEVSEYMRISRGFVQHSLHTSSGDSEGTPVAVLEAMACGLPVVSTFHNGIADVISHMEDGLLVNENDVIKMSEYMMMLIDDPIFADQLGRNARKKIEENFELSKVISSLNDIFSATVKNFSKNGLP